MVNEPTAETLWVTSDLHLAPPSELLQFHAHERLVGLLDEIAESGSGTRVVLNGDVFDFLQLPDYGGISLPLAANRMGRILDALDEEPPERNVVQAFRRLTRAGHALHCLPGNHDPELNLASVQRVLNARLGASQELAAGQGYWRVKVGNTAVVGLHGHAEDPFNAISSARMLDAQRDGDETVPMPSGSRLVREVINPYRRAQQPDGTLRFPFVDLLPGEKSVVLALLYLDPRLAMKRIHSALGIGTSALVRQVTNRMGLSSPQLAQRQVRAMDDNNPLVDSLVNALVEAMTPDERQAEQVLTQELGNHLEGTTRQPRTGMLAAGHPGRIEALILRALCATLADGRNAFAPDKPDPLANEVIRTWGRGTIAVTGHTHAAKHIEHAEGTYLNTGTWQDLVRVPDDLSTNTVADWLGRLQRDEVKRWRICSVARITCNNASLLHWNGDSLVDWKMAIDG